MPKLLTDEQVEKVKSAMDLMEKLDKENAKLKDEILELKKEIYKLENYEMVELSTWSDFFKPSK